MALIWADRVADTTTTTGTGALTVSGSAPAGFRTFSSVCSTNDVFYYTVQAVDGSSNPTGDWETGLGTYSSSNTVTRTTVLASSNSNNAVNFSSGTKQVWIDNPADVLSRGAMLQSNYKANLYQWVHSAYGGI